VTARVLTRDTTAMVKSTDLRPLVSRRRAARVAGVSYLVMFALAIFANFGVRESMIVPDNAAATVANLTKSMGLFRLGLMAFLAIFVLDVVIAWALHIVFREVSQDVSVAAAWFRVVYAGFLGVALASFFDVQQLLNGPGYLDALSVEQVNARVMQALGSFESTWLVGLVAFGAHLVLLGVLVIRSGFASRALGFALLAAGAAYALDTIAHGMLPDYESYAGLFATVVAIPSMIGEGWLGVWLIATRRLKR